MIRTWVHGRTIYSAVHSVLVKGNRNVHLNFKWYCSSKPDQECDHFSTLIEQHKSKILYSCYLESRQLVYGYKKFQFISVRQRKEQKAKTLEDQCVEPIPLSLKYLSVVKENQHKEKTEVISEMSIIQFPYERDKVAVLHTKNEPLNNGTEESLSNDLQQEIRIRREHINWMTEYENYDDAEITTSSWEINYGSPDPNSSISNTPCGGCGALLHCKDTAIPGYIPSEIYKNYQIKDGVDLKAIICQRCYFLNHFNLALQVRVSPIDYISVLQTIQHKRALIILLVDLLDFPCSLWPGIGEILGGRKPLIVVGNKVDLLPQDSYTYLTRMKEIVEQSVLNAGISGSSLKHVALISAKTGFGIEELINKLHNIWQYKGDVYLVGCTNVGKSSLFNILLQSDYCKIQAADLIQRATTSLWPGTTMNLLKFPIMRPTGWRLFVRTKRLQSASRLRAQQERLRIIQLRKTRDPKYAVLAGYLDRTFSVENKVESSDPFGDRSTQKYMRLGIDENDAMYRLNKWCYDTPGVVQPDQIIDLLTTEELMILLPREVLRPRTFCMRVGTTIYLGGVARLDYLEGSDNARFTVFCADTLPITVCTVENADTLYKQFLGTELFKVPSGNSERMNRWPELKNTGNFEVIGIDRNTSAADVVLSSAGWIAVTGHPSQVCVLRAWTPDGRGVHVRNSLLPKSVKFRGKISRGTPIHKNNKFFIN